jgi:hypothetical protein
MIVGFRFMFFMLPALDNVHSDQIARPYLRLASPRVQGYFIVRLGAPKADLTTVPL